MEPEFYVRNRTGDLMSRATNDLNAVRMVLGPGIMYSGHHDRDHGAGASVFMVKLSPSLTLVGVAARAVCGGRRVLFRARSIHRLSERIQASLGVLSTRAQENLTGVRVIRAYAQEKPEIAAFERPTGITSSATSS